METLQMKNDHFNFGNLLCQIQVLYIFTGFIGVGLISLSGGINDVSFEIDFLFALIASISYGIAVNMVDIGETTLDCIIWSLDEKH